MLKSILFVGLGGMAGSISRYVIGTQVDRFDLGSFPLGTLSVNLIGCFLIGLFYGALMKTEWFDQYWGLILITGFCGGFTTFSTFSMDNYNLIQQSEFFTFILYSLLSLALGLLALWGGLLLTK